MLRTVAAVEQRPWLLLGLVFIATCIFGFLIQAGGSVYLQLRAMNARDRVDRKGNWYGTTD